MESTATAAHDPVIMPRTSSRNAFTHQASFKSEGSLAEPPMPPRRTDSLAHSRMNSTDSLASTTSTAPETVLTPKSPRRLNKNLISGVENSSLPSSAVPAPGPETNNGTQWSEVAAESARKDVSPVPVPRRNDSAPIVAEPAVEPVDQPASKPDPSPKPVAATKPSPVAVAGTIEPSLHSQEVPSKPRIQVAETPAVASIEAPQSLVTEKQKPTPKDSSLSHVEEDAALMATLREMLPPSPQVASPVSDMVIAVAAVSGAAKPGTSALQALNANLSPIVAQPAQAAAVSVAQRAISGPRTPTSPTSPVLNLGADDALIYSHMIGIEDPEAAERIRMKAQLVQVEPVVENYAGRDLETVDEEEEAQTDPDPDSGSASEPKSCKIYEDEEEDPRFPRKNTEHSPFGHSQSMEELDSERDYSGPIISGLPRSSSTPRLDAIRGVGRLSTYQPSVSSPLAGGRAPRKRRKSFRGNRPTAYGTARHSMVGLTPENMEELKKDAHAAIRDMLLRSVEEDQMKERKRQSKLRQSTVPTDDYASFSRPESYYPDDTASQISEGDRSSNFAPSMRTSRTAPDLNSRSPPKSSAFRMARDDHRASMMALDNLMRNDNNYGDSDDAFELGSMSSDLHGDMHGDYDDDDMEDGSSGRGSSMPLGDNLFDSDILSLDQAEKALKYARRTQDVDERYHFIDFLLDHLPDLPPCDDKGDGPSSEVAHNAVKILRRLAYVHYHPPSQYTLGNLFITGLPDNVRNRSRKHKPDYGRAFELWVMAAKRNHADATYNVALCTERGLGTRASQRRAADFYRKAAVLNHPGAMTRLGTALLNGELGLSKSPRDAIKWLRIALKYADTRFPRVCVELSKLHAQGVEHVVIRDDEYAFELLKRGSELGDPEAQHRLGRAYELGRMHSNTEAPQVTSSNPKIAIQLYQAAANQGHPEAMLEISGWYLTGWPRPGEEIKAPQKRFGKEPPFTFPQSDELAYKWARQAAEKGLGRGFYAVAYFFEHGIGTGLPPDTKEACKWYEMAAKKGDKSALKKVQELGGRTSRFSMIWPSSFSMSGSAGSATSSRAPSTMSSRRSSMYSMSATQAAAATTSGLISPVSEAPETAETPATTMSAMMAVSSPMNSKAASVVSMPVDTRKAPQQKKKGRKVCSIQ